jgi:hypothetical protein
MARNSANSNPLRTVDYHIASAIARARFWYPPSAARLCDCRLLQQKSAKSAVWKKVFEILAADADNEYAMIDSMIGRAHQHIAGAQSPIVESLA